MPLKIETGEHHCISTVGVRAPHLFRLKNGEVLLTFHVQGDMHFPQRVAMRSRDNGATWSDDPPRCYKEFAWGENADGIALAFERDTFEIEQGRYLGHYFKSADGGVTFDGPHETTVHINGVDSRDFPSSEAHYPEADHIMRRFYSPVPDAYKPLIDKASRRRGIQFWRYILEENGRWLATVFGHFFGDNGLRCVLIESIDEGRTWRFVSVIAYEFNRFIDGTCEPVMRRVADGSLLCMMRRGGNHPLAQCRSVDNGQTWSPIELQVAQGVDPDLCLMSHGVLAGTYGRPGQYIMFSEDGCGHTWGYHHNLLENTCHAGSSSMMGIAEVAPGKLLVVYDARTDKHPGGGRNDDNCSIWSTTVAVKRTSG